MLCRAMVGGGLCINLVRRDKSQIKKNQQTGKVGGLMSGNFKTRSSQRFLRRTVGGGWGKHWRKGSLKGITSMNGKFKGKIKP